MNSKVQERSSQIVIYVCDRHLYVIRIPIVRRRTEQQRNTNQFEQNLKFLPVLALVRGVSGNVRFDEDEVAETDARRPKHGHVLL